MVGSWRQLLQPEARTGSLDESASLCVRGSSDLALLVETASNISHPCLDDAVVIGVTIPLQLHNSPCAILKTII